MQQLHADKVIKDQLVKMIAESKRVEHTEACNHQTLERISDSDTWYKCEKCGLVLNIYNTIAYKHDDFKKVYKEIGKAFKK